MGNLFKNPIVKGVVVVLAVMIVVNMFKTSIQKIPVVGPLIAP